MSRRKISEQVTVGVLDKEWELAKVIPCLLGKKEAQLLRIRAGQIVEESS